jgi:hypothetical protein
VVVLLRDPLQLIAKIKELGKFRRSLKWNKRKRRDFLERLRILRGNFKRVISLPSHRLLDNCLLVQEDYQLWQE